MPLPHYRDDSPPPSMKTRKKNILLILWSVVRRLWISSFPVNTPIIPLSHKIILIITLLCFTSYPSHAQTTPDPATMADDLMDIPDEDDIDYEARYENLILQRTHPLDLNKATREDLQALYLLSDVQIQHLLDHRQRYGPVLSLYELQTIPGYDTATIRQIMPFVTLHPTVTHTPLWQRILHEKNNYLLIRYERTLEKKRGHTKKDATDQQFTGTPEKMLMRFRSSRAGDFSLGLLMEKDAGEPLPLSPQARTVDFTSFHVHLMNKGRIKDLLIGDFQLQAGQGLVMGSLFGLGKGGQTTAGVRRSTLGVRPATAANENTYLRGLATTLQIQPHITLTPFYAYAKRDATLSHDTTGQTFIRALQTSGLHRTPTERAHRKTVAEQQYGTLLHVSLTHLSTGMVWHTTRYSLPFAHTATPYNQLAFTGPTNHNVSFYANYQLAQVSFFGEIAKSMHAGTAAVGGLLTPLTPRLDVALIYRHYARHYYSFYSSGFGETSGTQNETGVYWGWKYQWHKKLYLTGYIDLFRFPWLRYRSYAPGHGYAWRLQLTYEPSHQTKCYLQIQEKEKPRNLGNDTTTYTVLPGTKRHYRLHLQFNAHQYLQLKTRIQHSTYTYAGLQTHGWTFVQDVQYRVGKLTLSARHALFDTDDYENRQYVYEQDVRFAFSFPAYNGQGIRNYILARYKFNRHISGACKLARTRYANKDHIGTGADTINGHTRHDIKLQCLIHL